MTLYAPPTDRQAYRLIARRLVLGRPALMAVCFTAFVSSIVTSSYSNYDLAVVPDVGMDDLATSVAVQPNAEAQRDYTHASTTTPILPAPPALARAQHAEVIPSFDDADALIRAAIKASHPKFEARPLPDAAMEADMREDVLPDQPEASILMASLTPPQAGGQFPGDRLFPRMPDTESLAIIPHSLETRAQRDSIAPIDTRSDSSEPKPQRDYRVETLQAAGGETLADLLDSFSINEDDKRATLVALRADSISETLSPDDRVDLAFRSNRKLGANKLFGIRLHFDAVTEENQRVVELRWDGEMHDLWAGLPIAEESLQAEAFRPITTSEALDGHVLGTGPERVFLQGVIHSSLYEAADDAGMTPGEALTLTDIFRYLIDFERDLRAGDRFEVLFEKKENGDYGDILYAMIENRGKQIALFRGKTSLESFEYFDKDGKTNKRALMRTPLGYDASISSNYGMRRHPIDGYRKMHKGVDFRARTGTPILAAGSGTVDYIGRRGGYGKYIRIRHNGTYKTAYAHMSRYAKGLSKGMRVKQGDIIGYVGSTGRSTGPHLHFEVLKNKEQINPMTVGDFGAIKGLTGSELAHFKAGIARINLVVSELRPKAVVAAIE